MFKLRNLLLLLIAYSSVANSENDIAAGIGLGAQYHGLGFNVYKSDTDTKSYVAVGCNRGSSDKTKCGVGVGILKSDIIPNIATNHMFGIHTGVSVATKKVSRFSTEYLLAPQYVYYINESKKGLNLGVAGVLVYEYNDLSTEARINIGYDF